MSVSEQPVCVDDHEHEDYINNHHGCVNLLPAVDSQWDSAMYLLCSSQKLSLTHAAATDLCDSTQTFVECIASKIQERVFKALENNQIVDTPLLSDHITHACRVDGIFMV